MHAFLWSTQFVFRFSASVCAIFRGVSADFATRQNDTSTCWFQIYSSNQNWWNNLKHPIKCYEESHIHRNVHFKWKSFFKILLMIALVNKDFVPWEKKSVSVVFLDAEFKYVSEFLYHPHLSHCIGLVESRSLHMWVTWESVGVSLDML